MPADLGSDVLPRPALGAFAIEDLFRQLFPSHRFPPGFGSLHSRAVPSACRHGRSPTRAAHACRSEPATVSCQFDLLGGFVVRARNRGDAVDGKREMASVRFDSVVKKFGAFTAVSDLNLEIMDKEFLVLLGPSGCGKTTTMRMVAGLEEVTAGDIYIGDRPGQRRAAEISRRGDGLPVLRALPAPHGRGQHRLSPEDPEGAEAGAAPRSSARSPGGSSSTACSARLPKELSGGQRQRVALARAIVRTPQGLPDGRAALQPRRQAPRPDAGRAEASAA